MSSYKAAIAAAPSPSSAPDYRVKARQLQEAFPSWSNDDLHSLLHEVSGDVELAATRISEGHAEQWGAVTRKKDKKPATPVPKESATSPRGDLRGTRGALRGGRGGSIRGGAAPRARGSVVRPANGHHVPLSPGSNAWADGPPGIDKSVADKPVDNAWGAPEPAAVATWNEAAELPSTTPASWGNTSEADVNGVTHQPQSKPAAKTPATSKMSWAQIARPQEKPTPPPALAPVAPPPVVAPAVAEPEPQPQMGWEEPTTVQTPSWEEETVVIKPSTSAADVWASTVAAPEPSDDPITESKLPDNQPEEVPAPPIVETLPPPVDLQPAPPAASPSPSLKPNRPTPSSHRNSARYKVTDQPVVMPSSFGSGLEKVGMQFGSLSLGGETSFDNAPEPEAAPEPQAAAPSPPAPQTVPPPHHDAPPQANVPPSSTSMGSALFQQGLASSQPPVSSHSLPSSVSQPVVSQKSTPLMDSLATQPPPMQQEHQLTPQQQYMQQHMAAGGYMPPQLQLQQPQPPQQPPHQHVPQQSHSQHQHQYSQHGLPTHIDPSQPNPQHPANSGHSSYFRSEPTSSTSSPYGFHAPTPPAGQVQDTPYGTFSPLGGQGQQGGHLSGFAQDYGHDNQRGFYDSYQNSTFNRGVLGHDDVKGLSGPQQPPSAAGLPPSGQSTAQLGNAQNTNQQPASAAPQGQQYSMHPSYYFPYPQNQYYGAPYNPSGYNVGPYVKYPTMYGGPPGPGGNGPAPSQQGQANLGVKGQTQGAGPSGYGPGQGVYPGGYDDYSGQGQNHGGHQQQQHSLGLGQGGAEYGKPLYGGAQSFMGLGGQGPSGGPQSSNARGGSPETQYKPYGKDVGVSGRGSGGVQQGQGQGQQGQGQTQGGPPGQGFYGGNRFGGAGGSGPQQSAHHQPAGHLGYSQAQNDFYPYQGRQQQFWQ